MHNTRASRCKSTGGTVNSAASRRVYTRRQVSSGTLRFLQRNPWLTCQRRLWLLQTWSTCSSVIPALLWILFTDKPESLPPPPPTSHSHDCIRKAYKLYTLGVIPLTRRAAVLFRWQQDNAFFFRHKPTFSHVTPPPPHLVPTTPDTRTSFCSHPATRLATRDGKRWGGALEVGENFASDV